MLYHYTSTETAEKILSSGSMRATHLAFVNDSREFRHGIELLIASLPKELPTGVREYAERALVAEAENGGAFIACFSRKLDDLNQWRAYGGKSTGVMLAFDSNALARTAAESRTFDVMPVAYDDAEHRELVAPFVARFEAALEFQKKREAERPEFPQPMNWRGVVEPMFYELQGVVPRIKDKRFREEEEVRLVVSPWRHTKRKQGFRVGMGGAAVVPYVELQALSALRQVWIGPGRFTAEAVRGMRWLVASKGLPATVEVSTVPFRGW